MVCLFRRREVGEQFEANKLGQYGATKQQNGDYEPALATLAAGLFVCQSDSSVVVVVVVVQNDKLVPARVSGFVKPTLGTALLRRKASSSSSTTYLTES